MWICLSNEKITFQIFKTASFRVYIRWFRVFKVVAVAVASRQQPIRHIQEISFWSLAKSLLITFYRYSIRSRARRTASRTQSIRVWSAATPTPQSPQISTTSHAFIFLKAMNDLCLNACHRFFRRTNIISSKRTDFTLTAVAIRCHSDFCRWMNVFLVDLLLFALVFPLFAVIIVKWSFVYVRYSCQSGPASIRHWLRRCVERC